ncbi:MAG: hypothetical protein KJ048_15800 [Dehalococcoidia bacterium]|nr:hypothetical protein [Dehalococcoidia bacterium]
MATTIEPDSGQDLGPDERDLDLLDGSWEQEYYSGRQKTRDWNAVFVAFAILIVAAMLVPMLLVFAR